MNAPQLTLTEIKQELERIFGKNRRSGLVALYGRGERAEIHAAGRDFVIIPTRCELEMRAAMPGPDEAVQRVFLIDWTERSLPLDLSCRLAAGRVFQITSENRLMALFGARELDPSLIRSGLARVLLSEEVFIKDKISGLTLNREEAYRKFMDLGFVGYPARDELTCASLLAWSVKNENGPGLMARANKSPAWKNLSEELRGFIGAKTGFIGQMIWTAWEQNLGECFVHLAALADAWAGSGEAVAEGILRSEAAKLGPGFGSDIIDKIVDLIEERVLRESLELLPDNQRLLILQRAEALIEMPMFQSVLPRSELLPAGHLERQKRLAKALKALLEKRSNDSLKAVLDAHTELQGHCLDEIVTNVELTKRRALACRLGAYLVHRQEAPPPDSMGPVYQRALGLASDYSKEGGYVDWCRQQLRQPLDFQSDLKDAIKELLSAADELRRDDDSVFADGIVSWLEAGKPSIDVLPIESATKNLAADFLKEVSDRRLLIVLMDGMSWTSAVQLLDRLERQKWSPILWRPLKHKNALSLPPVLASLPSITQTSRAAFFAGKADAKLGDKNTSEDRKRWRKNPSIKPFLDVDSPELFLRKNLTENEELATDLKKAIESQSRVVAVVVNAIDEELKGSSQIVRDYSSEAGTIKPLEGLLASAAGAERVVLLASDHGHVPGDGMTPHGEAKNNLEGGRRWRSLAKGEVPKDFERVLPKNCWKPATAARVAVLCDEHVSNGHPAHGEHGGICLAEVVAPAILIAPEWLAQIQGAKDIDLETRACLKPSWWHLDDIDLSSPMEQLALGPKPVARAGEQMTLIDVAPVVPKTEKLAVVTELKIPLIESLKKSSIFKKQISSKSKKDVEFTLKALTILADSDGPMKDETFARKLGRLKRHVGGLVPRIGGVLNYDGFAIIEHDPIGGQVTFHKQSLIEQYEIKE